MALRKQVTWEELRVGIFVLVGLIIIAVGIFYVTDVRAWGAKYTLRTYLPSVDNLQDGAPVTLGGVPIGNVEAMNINMHPSDPMHSIEIVMRVQSAYQPFIRSTSDASLATQGLLGQAYISITRGYTGEQIQNNGIVPGAPGKDIVAGGAQVEANLNALLKQVGDIVADIHSGKGTAGALIYDRSLYNHFDSVAASAQSLVANVKAGKGSVGKLLVSDDLYNKFDASASHLESMTNAIQSQQGSLGKLVYDRAFYDKANKFLDNTNGLISGVRNGQGTVGKLFTDETLFTNLRDASANFKGLTDKMNNGQGTFGKFFTDPQLYDNLTGLTGDTRLLIGDFRRNPKKFLQIHLNIF
ncbi:MAG TPA: MlaD family protein [Candidatus Acidoferrales bacterium]|nr:MlaD family protein [Candidatus Acidoferrales bacterium]